MNEKLNRRDFSKLAVLTAATVAPARSSSFFAASPQNKVILAIAGAHSRGHYLAGALSKLHNVEVRYVIDVVRWALGLGFPSKLSNSGDRYNFVGQDDWNFFDTQDIAIAF